MKEENISLFSHKTPINPATQPALTPDLRRLVVNGQTQVINLLRGLVTEFGLENLTFASSLGAEDMVLSDMIAREALNIETFTLDTGRLPPQTYLLMAQMEKLYDIKLKVYFPDTAQVESYVHAQGVNAFYNSVALRKQCCHIRKVAPLARALAHKKAWITGLRSAQSTTRDSLEVRAADPVHGLEKISPLASWSETQIWAYIRLFDVPFNPLHEAFYPSIGCAPCSRPVAMGEDIRAGRWWWEDAEGKECGLHQRK